MHSNELYRNRVGSKPSLCKTPTRESSWINVSIKKGNLVSPPSRFILVKRFSLIPISQKYDNRLPLHDNVCYTELFFYTLLIQCEQRIDGGVSENNCSYSNILSIDYFIFHTSVILSGASETISEISQNKTIKTNTDKELHA